MQEIHRSSGRSLSVNWFKQLSTKLLKKIHPSDVDETATPTAPIKPKPISYWSLKIYRPHKIRCSDILIMELK